VAEDFLPAFADLGAGTQIASYRLGEQIGWGGMAAVYRARDVRLDRWVALKVLAPEVAGDDSFRQRFAFESKAAAAVDHPNIIPVFDAGESGGVLYIAMRYVGGGDVRTLLHESGRLDVAQVAATIAQVASALDAAHAAGLVHRDVKPANILLAGSGGSHPDHVYLTDFGLSRTATAVTSPGLIGRVTGTLDYMAPEQIDGRRVDGRADLYGLACTAYEMLAGEAPFHRGQDLQLLRQQFAESPLPLTSLRPDLLPVIDLVLARALARSPDERYGTCLDFAASLVRACGLEWGVIGQLLPGSPRPAVLDAPAVGAVPLGGAVPPAGALPAARQPAGDRDGRAGDGWSPAPPLIAAHSMTVAHPPARARQTAMTAALTGRDPALGGPGIPEYLAGPPGPPGWRSPVIAAAILVVLLAMAGGTYLAFRGNGAPAGRPSSAAAPHHAGGSPGAAGGAGVSSPASTGRPGPSASTTRPGRRHPARPLGPAATVSAYIAAVNRHHYARAWHLRGRDGTTTYAAFVQGFSTTAKDALFILGVSGDVVTVRLDAQQTDGSVKTYQGTYTVQDGVITTANIRQIS
jgi:serine/threonine-protein kinase